MIPYESAAFRLESVDRVATLWFDFRNSRGNSLTLATLNELSLLIDRVAECSADLLIVRSSRPDVFLNDFDIRELAGFRSPMEFSAFATRGQDLTRKIANLPFPSLAFIDGRCEGVGLEIALAASTRSITDSPSTVFTFPAIDRGLIPCWGGIYRLANLVGRRPAESLLMNATGLDVSSAFKIGLADRVCPANRANVDLMILVDELSAGRSRPRFGFRRLVRAIRQRCGGQFQKNRAEQNGMFRVESATSIADVLDACRLSEGEAGVTERVAVTRLAESAQHLLALHLRATKDIRVVPEPVNPVPPTPRRIGIVGGGGLGSNLAARFAGHGLEVVIQERHADVAEAVARTLGAKVSASVGSRIRTTAEWVGFDNLDLVIETAEEDPGIKRNLFNDLERRLRPRTPLVTASTTISVESLAAELSRPSRVAGLHFPNIESAYPIAEITGGPLTDSATIAALLSWSRQWGFVPARIADRPGRLVSHVSMTYLSEGVALVSEGLPIDQIDAACRRFGFARGPLEWCDEFGLERLAELTAQFQLARGDNFARNLLFQRLLPYGWRGKPSGEGFYRHRRTTRPNSLARMVLWRDLDEDAVAHYIFDPKEALREGLDRIVFRTVNEAAACLVDEPDADPATVDMALALGMNWAPFRGGPLRYADDIGLGAVVERLSYLEERFGRRFAPCDELLRRAEAGESFYGGATTDEPARVMMWRVAG